MSSVPYFGTNGFGIKPTAPSMPISASTASSNSIWKYLVALGIVLFTITIVYYAIKYFSKKDTSKPPVKRNRNPNIDGEMETYSEIGNNGQMLTWTYPKGQFDTIEDVKKFGELYVQKRRNG